MKGRSILNLKDYFPWAVSLGSKAIVSTILFATCYLDVPCFADGILPTTDYYFTRGYDGASPYVEMTLANDGNFYGTTFYGGTNDNGVIFRLSTNDVFTPLYSFTGGIDGAGPQAALVQASDNNLYGTTLSGGSNLYYGTVFRISTNGVFKSLYSFTNGIDGSNPLGLTKAADGNLYGAASHGGTNGAGTIYRLSTNGVVTPLYSMITVKDGSSPQALISASDGFLYGTADAGGSNFLGTIFRFSTNGLLTNLHTFNGASDGSSPDGTLFQASDGKLYGTAQYGGAMDYGSVFRITTNGVFNLLYSFTGGSDGYSPKSGFIQATDGKLYGQAFFGGASDNGTIFQMTTNGVFSSLYSFNGTNDGGNPQGNLLQAPGGRIYSTLSQGAINYNNGTIFSFVVYPTPANDTFANRKTLTGLDSGYTIGSTFETNEPNPGATSVNISNTVWWTWQAPTNGPVSIQTIGSSFDTLINVYTGSSLPTLAGVASNLTTVLDTELYPDLVATAGITNRVGFTAIAGVKYNLQLSGLTLGLVNIAAQTTALKLVSVSPLSTNSDGSIPFNAVIQIGNSGSVTPGPLQLKVLAHAGASYNTQPPNGPPDPAAYPADLVLSNYFLTNPVTVLPGQTTNLTISGICPGPTVMKQYPSDSTNTLGFGWGVFAVLNEKFGTNYFYDDTAVVFYGKWPVLGTNTGPQAGVVRINPSVSGSTPVFKSAQINGPTFVNQNSSTNYFGTANFVSGSSTIPVNFTNTAWVSSRFTITNGVFQTGSVVTNSPVTLTALYSYTYYGLAITNTNQVSVLVMKSTSPVLGSAASLFNHAFSLILNTFPTNKFIIQAATNLVPPVTWTPLATNITDTNGVWVYLDSGATNRPSRFYRAVRSP